MATVIQPCSLPDLLKPGMLVYIPGSSAEPLLLIDALRENSDCCDGVTFLGVFLPGVNNIDFAGFHPNSRMRSFFLPPHLHTSYAAGKIDFITIPYSAIPDYLAQETKIDLALLQLSLPDSHGHCSLGVSADFSGEIFSSAKTLVGHLNPEMPMTRGAPTIPLDQIDFVLEQPEPLLEYEAGSISPELKTIGHLVASLIRDGDTIQMGIGKLQPAVIEAVKGARRLRLHSGMISDPLLELFEAGAIEEQSRHPRQSPVITAVALGTRGFYQALENYPSIRFAPVRYTHSLENLLQIDHLVSINSVLEIDLFGQVNAETVGGRTVSAAAGLTDFQRGARFAKSGRAVIALPSTAKGGAVSRIVPTLGPAHPVSLARTEADFVVTENGVTDLRYKPVNARAEAIISLAHPKFQPELEEAWRKMENRMILPKT